MTVALAEQNPPSIEEWLHTLYGTFETGWLTLFAIDRTTGDKPIRWASIDDLDTLAADARQLAERCCVWLGVATRREHLTKGRGGAADCDQLPGLWVDIDVAGPNHANSHDLPPTLDTAHQLLDDFPLPPTAVVHTGGGLQAWWLFAEPHPVDDRLLARWGHQWASIGRRHGWHVDNVFDAARVMRLPGTFNRKNTPAPVTVTTWRPDLRHEPGDLDEHLTDPPVTAPPTDERRVPYIGPERPGDAFNATAHGGTILHRAGFHSPRNDRDGSQHWVRPGKDARQGHSATVHADGYTTIWSDACTQQFPAVEINHPYKPFGLYAALFHHGDYTAASDDLEQQGFGTKAVQPDLSWILDDTDAQADAPAVDEPWPDPTPLDRPRPPFPLDALPAWIAEHCVAVADWIEVPPDLCAQIALGAMSAVAMGHVVVDYSRNRRTHVNLYLATAAESGAGKSPADAFMVGPLRRWEQARQEQLAPELHKAQWRKENAERRAKHLRDSLKVNANEQTEAEAWQAELDAKAIEVPAPFQLIAEDLTPEMLAVAMARQGGRLAILSTEAEILDQALGGYGDRANLSIYLKGHDGQTFKQQRKGSGGQPGTELFIAEALLTVAIGTQPRVLDRVAANPELIDRGFTARFMYAYPTSIVGARTGHRADSDDSIPTLAGYEAQFVAYADRLHAAQHPKGYRFSDASRALFKRWRWVGLEPRISPGGDLRALSSWIAKLDTSVIRLAGLIHYFDYEPGEAPDEIGDDTVARAIEIGEYWIEHALAVVGANNRSDRHRVAARLLAWLREHPCTEVTFADLVSGNRRSTENPVAKAADLVEPAMTLVELGWLRPTFVGELYPRQGKTFRFAVHPDISRADRADLDRGESPTVQNVTDSGQDPRDPRGFLRNGFSASSSSFSPDPTTTHPRPRNPRGSRGSQDRPVSWLLAPEPDTEEA